jgi:hypothetical protein
VCLKFVPAKAHLTHAVCCSRLLYEDNTLHSHYKQAEWFIKGSLHYDYIGHCILLEVHLINYDGRCPMSEIDMTHTTFSDLAILVFRSSAVSPFSVSFHLKG